VKPSLLAGYAVAMLLAARTALAAPLPALPDAVARPDAKETEAGLWMIFDNFENDVKNSPLRVRDPALNSYVRDVICKIAASTCGSLRVYIVNDPSFNASAAPNGMVIVNTGLLLRSENEAQLAFVLGTKSRTFYCGIAGIVSTARGRHPTYSLSSHLELPQPAWLSGPTCPVWPVPRQQSRAVPCLPTTGTRSGKLMQAASN